MDERLIDFIAGADAHLNAAETAVLRGRQSAGYGARTALGSLAAAAGRLDLTRCETIAQAAAEMIARGEDCYPMALRALMRLRDVLAELSESGREPAGDDADLVAAATQTLPPSIAETLAQAHARLLEISPGARDPRLSDLMERLGRLSAEIEPMDAAVPEEAAPRTKKRGPRA